MKLKIELEIEGANIVLPQEIVDDHLEANDLDTVEPDDCTEVADGYLESEINEYRDDVAEALEDLLGSDVTISNIEILNSEYDSGEIEIED